MYNKKELATIMGALIEKSINIKDMIENREYICQEELDSLKRQADILDKLANRTADLINKFQ